MEKDFKIGCLKIENEKLKKVCILKDKKIRNISSTFYKRINRMVEVRKRAVIRHRKRKEQSIHDHDEIESIKKILYKLHPELKDKYNAISAQIRKRDKYSCIFCYRNVFEIDPNYTIHHIIPKHLGGGNELDNQITICGDCHKTLEIFNQKIISYINSPTKPKKSRNKQ